MSQAKFKANCSYLVKRSGSIHKIDVLEVTKTCYKYKFEHRNLAEWETIEKFEFHFSLVEDLGEAAIQKSNTSLFDGGMEMFFGLHEITDKHAPKSSK